MKKLFTLFLLAFLPLAVGAQVERTIHVAEAGTLSSYISEEEKCQIEELTLTGEINGTDFGFLREMAGKSMECKNDNLYYPDTEGKLSVLDLSGVRILAGGNYYMIWDGIDNYFFYNLTNDNEIPPYIFNDCKKLTSIILPESINIIGQGAFSGTGWYNNQPDGMVYIGKVSYTFKGDMPPNTQIIIKDGTRSIACSAFGDQSNLTSAIIPNSVTYIGGINEEAGPCAHRGAFEGCTGLTSIIMPSSLITIGRSAFFGCNGLASITIPGSVRAFGWTAFYGCSGLTSIVSEIQDPFDIKNSVFDCFDKDIYATATLTVPAGTKAKYQSTYGWKEFVNIVEMEEEEETTEDVIKITSVGQTTWCSAYDLDFSNVEGLKAYTATGYHRTKGTIWLTRVKEVPAGEGILLIGDEGEYKVPHKSTTAYYANLMVGTLKAITINETDGEYTNYYLSNGASGVGFYKVNGSVDIKANRAYLPLLKNTVSGTRGFIGMDFDDDEDGTTGIEVQSSIFNVQSKDVYYNLQGQRVDNPTKGLYIRNGKKVVIK